MVDLYESAEFECGLESWSDLVTELQAFDGTLEQAIQSFGGDVDKSLSATTRKRLSTKSLHGLIHWRGRLHDVISKLETLKNASRSWQETVKQAEDCRRSAEGQLGEVMSEVQSTMDSLRIERAEKNSTQRELDAITKRALQFEEENRRLTAVLHQTQGQLETQRFASDEAVASMEEIQREKETLKRIADEAQQRALQSSSLVKGLQEETEKAKKLAERQQQVVAKLTADNLVFMMKLKETEGKLKEAATERDLHKLAVEKKKGPWFNEIRESVEARVRDALSEAQELERQMERLRQMHKQQLGEVSKEKLVLRNAVESAANRIEELEKLGRLAENSKARAEQERDLALKTCEVNEKKIQSFEAEIRVLSESMRTIREESSKIWMKEQQFNSRMASLESDLEGQRNVNTELERKNASLSNQLKVQISVNREVMRRKETIEWELMELRAHGMDARATRGPLNPLQNRPIQPVIPFTHQKETKAAPQSPENRHQQDEIQSVDDMQEYSPQQIPPQAPIDFNQSDVPDDNISPIAMSTMAKVVKNETICRSGISCETGSPGTFQSASCPGDAPLGQDVSSKRDHIMETPTTDECMNSKILARGGKSEMDTDAANCPPCQAPSEEKGANWNSVGHDKVRLDGKSGEVQKIIAACIPEVSRERDLNGQPLLGQSFLESQVIDEGAEENRNMVETGLQLDALLPPKKSTPESSSLESGSEHEGPRASLPSTPSSLASCVQAVDVSHGEIDVGKENLGMNPWEEFEGLRGSGGGRRRARSIVKTEPSPRALSPK